MSASNCRNEDFGDKAYFPHKGHDFDVTSTYVKGENMPKWFDVVDVASVGPIYGRAGSYLPQQERVLSVAMACGGCGARLRPSIRRYTDHHVPLSGGYEFSSRANDGG